MFQVPPTKTVPFSSPEFAGSHNQQMCQTRQLNNNQTINEFRDLLVSIGPLGWGRRVPDVSFRLTLENDFTGERSQGRL